MVQIIEYYCIGLSGQSSYFRDEETELGMDDRSSFLNIQDSPLSLFISIPFQYIFTSFPCPHLHKHSCMLPFLVLFRVHWQSVKLGFHKCPQIATEQLQLSHFLCAHFRREQREQECVPQALWSIEEITSQIFETIHDTQ